MMLERILSPGLQLSAKNDTGHEQDMKHHCALQGKCQFSASGSSPLLEPVSIKGSGTAGTISLENGRSLNLCLVSKPHCHQGTEGFCLKCL